MFNIDKANAIIKKEDKIYNPGKFKSPLVISVYLLKSLRTLDNIIDKGLLEKYVNIVVDIWKPTPEGKEKEIKEDVNNSLPKYLKIVRLYSDQLWLNKPPHSKTSYEALLPSFYDLEKKFKKSAEEMNREYIGKSNPYITVSIDNSFELGKNFQLKAKISSSVETSWGGWIERVIPIFNNNITPIGAGGLDYILGRTCYDIKSGPNVMNKDQIEEARRKRESIIRMSKSEDLSEFVYINNFKVATAYGKLSSAKMFMREETGLIMFGRETWKELTGDEWNSFRLFLWQLRFVIENRVGNKWDRDSLNDAVLDFLKSFYDDYEDRQKYAVRMPEFIELQKLL